MIRARCYYPSTPLKTFFFVRIHKFVGLFSLFRNIRRKFKKAHSLPAYFPLIHFAYPITGKYFPLVFHLLAFRASCEVQFINTFTICVDLDVNRFASICSQCVSKQMLNNHAIATLSFVTCRVAAIIIYQPPLR